MLFIYMGRVLWARKFIVLIATLACLAGGATMLASTAKRYDAHNRVQLDFIKPDPITGFHLSHAKNAEPYMNSQMQLIRDFQVTSLVAEHLGWMDSTDLQQQYASLPAGTGRDFQHWVASRISDGVFVRPVEDSNLIEIRFRAVTPEVAKVIAAEVRNAYVENMSNNQAMIARANIPATIESVERSRAKLAQLENRKVDFERRTGMVVLESGFSETDLDARRLYGLTRSTPRGPARVQEAGPNTAANQLIQLDDAIAEASKSLGANNPQLLELRRRRELTAKAAAARTEAKDAGQIELEKQRQFDGELQNQRAKYLSQSEKRVELKLLQDEIRRESEEYANISQRLQSLQRMSSGGGGNVTPVGLTEGSDDPAYPNNALVLGGSGALGLVAGILLAMLAEMFSRRVRVPEDLRPVTERSVTVLPTVRLGGQAGFRRLAWLPWRRRVAA
jgi:succinoglycan biosynthesis transport protein ExoP